MKTNLLFCFVLLLMTSLCYGQKQYAGVYAGSQTVQFNMNIKTNDATDSVLKDLDSTSMKNLFSSMLESKIEIRMSFTANENARLVDIEVTDKPSFVQMNAVESRYLYLKNKAYRINSIGHVFEAAVDIPVHAYHFTGKTKTILGYTCHEATISSPGQDTGTAWICKELPASISPGIFLLGNPGAILEFSNASTKNTLIELKPSDTPELKAALESIRE